MLNFDILKFRGSVLPGSSDLLRGWRELAPFAENPMLRQGTDQGLLSAGDRNTAQTFLT